MKKKNKGTGYIIGTTFLCILLAVSIFFSLVVIGVIAEAEKNKAPSDTVTETVVNADGSVDVIVYENPTQVATGEQIGNVTPDVTEGVTVGNSVVSNNTPTQNSSQNQGDKTNPLLSTKKTKADIVQIYADVMNFAKASAPAFKKVEYQELPDGPDNRVISEGGDKAGDEAVNKMLDFVTELGVFIPKDQAMAEPYIHQKGDADMARFPVFDRAKGSYLTDPNGIDTFNYKIMDNGNIRMSFVLVVEDNPEPVGENSEVAPSYTGAVFSPMSKAKIDGTVYHPIVTVFARDIKYSLKYHDCSVVVEFNPETLQISYLEQIANVSIKGSGDVVGIGHIGLERQELLSYVYITDLTY